MLEMKFALLMGKSSKVKNKSNIFQAEVYNDCIVLKYITSL